MSESLITRIAQAIENKSLIELIKLRDICDALHGGQEKVIDKIGDLEVIYTSSDQPSDSIYEQLCSVIMSINTVQTIESRIKTNTLSREDYFMGSVPKFQEIQDIEGAVLMPKYDGVSCGMTFTRNKADDLFELTMARTRGVVDSKSVTTKGRKYTNITIKVKLITKFITDALNNEANQELQIGQNKLKDISEIIIRGEIVINNLEIVKDQVPASVVAGKINGGIDVWSNYINNITIKPFEIVRISAITLYTISQLEALELFNKFGFNIPYVKAKRIRPTNKSLEYVKKLFNTRFNNTVIEPCDGVVYSSINWLYPFDKDNNGKTDYGKYAWKPSNECTSIITEITETRSKDGYIEFSVSYMPVVMNNKTYNKLKIVPTTIAKFADKFGIGSVIVVMLRDDISPYIKECEIPSTGVFEPWHFPTTCSCCGQELEVITKKDSIRLKCINENCEITINKLCCDLCKKLGFKGIAEKTIYNYFVTIHQPISVLDLLTNPRSPAYNLFKECMSKITVKQFFTIAFSNIRGEKQMSELINSYKLLDHILDPILTHRAILTIITKDKNISQYTIEVAQAFLKQ